MLRISSLGVYLISGSWLAHRWVVSMRNEKSKATGLIRIISFVVICWLGVFVLGAIQTLISIAYFDPAEFPDDEGLTAEMVYDGAGNNAFAIFFGWIFVLICIGIAKLFKAKRTNPKK